MTCMPKGFQDSKLGARSLRERGRGRGRGGEREGWREGGRGEGREGERLVRYGAWMSGACEQAKINRK